MIAADIDDGACAAIELNAEANGVFVETIRNDLVGCGRRWEVIFAGDMFYERPLALRALDWLRQMARDGARVFVGDPGRTYFPKHGVERLCTYIVPTSRELEDQETRETSVYRLLPE